MHIKYVWLMVAILFEMLGTAGLQASEQFTRLVPSILVVVGFSGSMYFMTLTLRYMPVGIVYALWSGIGIVLLAIIGAVVFRQSMDIWAVIGMGLIIAGIVIIQLFSTTASH